MLASRRNPGPVRRGRRQYRVGTVGRSGNDLHYRGYDILDVATTCEFEEIAYLLVHGKLPNQAELTGYKKKLKSLRIRRRR